MLPYVIAMFVMAVLACWAGFKFGTVVEWRRSRDEHARKLWVVLNDELRGQGAAIMAIGYKACGRVPWDRARSGEVRS